MPQRILAVDDDAAYLAGIGELLEAAGYEVELAPTFHAARRAVQQRAPDLLLVDVRLGEYNGLQLVAEMSAWPTPIPTIVVSGFDDTVLRADATALGAQYVLKPITPSALLQSIEDCLRVRAADGIS